MLRAYKAGVKGCEILLKTIKATWPDGKDKSLAILNHSNQRQKYLDRIEDLESKG